MILETQSSEVVNPLLVDSFDIKISFTKTFLLVSKRKNCHLKLIVSLPFLFESTISYLYLSIMKVILWLVVPSISAFSLVNSLIYPHFAVVAITFLILIIIHGNLIMDVC